MSVPDESKERKMNGRENKVLGFDADRWIGAKYKCL